MMDPKDYPIRTAGPQDFTPLMQLCAQLHAENGQHDLDETKLAHLVWRGVSRQNAIIGVIGPTEDIRAMIYLIIDPVDYSNELQLLERWAFVREDSRRLPFAKRLVQFAIKCSEETGLELLIGILSDERLEAKRRLYKRQLTEAGTWFKHKPGEKSSATPSTASAA